MRHRIHVARAELEVASKSDVAIERETARKWADRAIACYRKCAGASLSAWPPSARLRWILRAEQYKHEALEHAALASHVLVRSLRREIDRAARASGCAKAIVGKRRYLK